MAWPDVGNSMISFKSSEKSMLSQGHGIRFFDFSVLFASLLIAESPYHWMFVSMKNYNWGSA